MTRADRAKKLRALSPEKRARLLEALRREAVERRDADTIPRLERGAEAPASFAQERLWLLDRLQPGSAAYNLSFAVRLKGELVVPALAAALDAVVRRHQVLGQAVAEGPEGLRLVAALGPPPFAEVDLVGLSESHRMAQMKRWVRADARRAFDLTRGPLLRATLLRLGEGENLLLLGMHHAVSDGWSNGILLREIGAFYTAALAGKAPGLPALPIQYGDFAAWQRGHLAGERLEELIAWWRKQLDSAPPVIDLPTDGSRSSTLEPRGELLGLGLPPETASALEERAEALGATPFMVLLAAFQALLGRWAGLGKVVVGSPVAGRERAEVQGLIGFFANTLVLYTDLKKASSFADLVGRVKATVLGAQDHAELPFERLVEALRPEREDSVNPLFQVVLSLQVARPPDVELPGLRLEPLPPGELHSGLAKFDLILFVDPEAPGEGLQLEIRRDLFARSTGARLLRHFRRLLIAALDAPETALDALPWIGASERHQMLVEWRESAHAVATEFLVHDLVLRWAEKTPDAISLDGRSGLWSYGELCRRSEALARSLASLEVGSQRIVGVALERSPELLVVLLGILRAGCAYLPLDPSYPEERLALMVADGGVRVVITGPSQAALFEGLPGVSEVIDGTSPPAFEGSLAPLPQASPDSPAYIVYTSGSTGRPKGVVAPHRAVVRLALGSSYLSWGVDEAMLHFAPISFDASTLEIWYTLARGGRLVVAPAGMPSLAELGDTILRSRVSMAWLTAGLFHQMVDSESAALRGIRQLVAGGDVLSVAHCRRFLESSPGSRLVNGYGPTENTVFTCCYPMKKSAAVTAPVPVGRPIRGTRIYVLDSAFLPVLVGSVGELCAGGPGLAQGYAQRARLTAERFVPEPWGAMPGGRLYRTGDQARFLPDGRVEFLGRRDQQVKVRGFRVELEEIELALAGLGEVARAAVVMHSRGSGDQRLVAFVVPATQTPGAALVGELRSALGERLPAYMVPDAWQVVQELPLKSSGKVDRRTLAQRPLEALEGGAEKGSLEGNPVVEMVAGLFEEVLGVAPRRREDDFFELGGHSLLATRLGSRIREVFDVELPLATLFEHSTVAGVSTEVSEALAGSGGEGVEPLVPAARGERLPLSFAQERLWVLDRFEPGSPTFNIFASVRLRGILDPARLDAALVSLVTRHEILRTTFGTAEGEPYQEVMPELTVSLPRVDLTALEVGDRRQALARAGQAVSNTSFDLASGPLLRLMLLRTAKDEHALLLGIHHIISDGWSIGLLVDELAATYTALGDGRRPQPPAVLQYADYAAWQRRQKALVERQVDYWRERLRGAPPGLELPTDHPRPGVRTYHGANVSLELDPELTSRLSAFARGEGATLFMVLLAAFKVILRRWSGERDVVVGAPVAGRGTPGVEGILGIFLNTLVLRTDLEGDPSFRTLVARVRDTALGAYAHQDVPFEKLIEDLKPERDLSRTPFFQVFFNMLNLPGHSPDLPELSIEPLEPPVSPAKFDLTVYAEERGETLHFEWVYNRDLFEVERMEELLRQYRGLLAQVMEAPERGIESFTLLSSTARQILPDPTTALEDRWIGSVHSNFSHWAEREPDRPAVLSKEFTWSYGELEDKTNRVAQALVAGGVRSGDVVAIYGRRDARMVVAVLGVLKAGAAFLVVDPAYPAERILACLRPAQPAGWIEMPLKGTRESLPEELKAHLASVPPRCQLRLPQGEALDEFLAAWPLEDPQVPVGPESLAYIAFTSGSTGRPKGILGRHGPLSHFIPWQQQEFGLKETDRFSMLSGIAHDPLQRDLFTPLQIGGALCVPEPDTLTEPGRLAEWIRSAEVTIAHLTPAMGQVLTESGQERSSIRLDRLRYAFLVGDILTRRDVARLQGLAPALTVVNFFGSTETQRAVGYATIPAITDNLPGGIRSNGGAKKTAKKRSGGTAINRSSGKAVLPLGRGVRNVQLLVLNRSGDLAGIGELGEIHVRSSHIARGYLGDPSGTATRFVPTASPSGERVYRTGDLGRYRVDGMVEFAGRADFQVKVRGFRIEPGEIERILEGHPLVRDSVVLAEGAASGEKQLLAYVAAPPSEELIRDLRRRLKEELPDYMMPAAFFRLDKLPLTPNGKLDRRALGRLERKAPEEGREEGVVPHNETERVIAAVLREVLGVPEVGRKDSIFELGGNSLVAVRVQSRLAEIFDREIQMVQLFTHPTVAELAAWLGDGAGPARPKRAVDRSAELNQGKDRRRQRFERMRRRRR